MPALIDVCLRRGGSATTTEAERLDLKSGVPVLSFQRINHTADEVESRARQSQLGAERRLVA